MPRAHHWGARRDTNEAELRRVARQLGATWLDLSVKDGPDAVVGFRGRNFLLEVKTAGGALSEGQKTFHRDWRGDVRTVRTVNDLLAILEKA